jgi:diacylglycerol kinase (ATP)
MKNLLKSFVYAIKGITYCIANERNMRIHLCFMTYMLGFLTYFDFFEVTKTQAAILIAACGVVMSLEAVNTAIEKAVDLETTQRNPLAAAAKDAAAGAVLISAVASVIIGIVILYQPAAFSALFDFYKNNPATLAVFIVSLIASFTFVFAGPKKIFRRRNK